MEVRIRSSVKDLQYVSTLILFSSVLSSVKAAVEETERNINSLVCSSDGEMQLYLQRPVS